MPLRWLGVMTRGFILTHVITPDPFQFAEPQLAQATYEKVRQAAEEGITDILISGKLRGVPHEVLMGEGMSGQPWKS
jgi:hypothetical protein